MKMTEQMHTTTAHHMKAITPYWAVHRGVHRVVVCNVLVLTDCKQHWCYIYGPHGLQPAPVRFSQSSSAPGNNHTRMWVRTSSTAAAPLSPLAF